MPYPTYDTVSAFTPMQQYALEQFVSYLLGWLSAEHKENGSHSAITADSVAVSGALTVGTTAIISGLLTARHGLALPSYVPTSAADVLYNNANALTWEDGTLQLANRATPFPTGAGGSGPLDAGLAASSILSTDATTSLRTIYSGPGGGGVARRCTSEVVATGMGAGETARATVIAGGGIFNAISLDCNPGGTNPNGGKVLVSNGPLICDSTITERARSVALGEWADVAFAAGNFTSDTGTWTLTSGDQTLFRYSLTGKTMTVKFQFDTTTVSGGQAQLRFAIPGGFTARDNEYIGGGLYNDNGAGWVSTGNIFVNAAGTFIGMQPGALGVGTWAAAVNTTAIRGKFSFEVQ